jgi:4-carboxymuconolactone decarboxylase
MHDSKHLDMTRRELLVSGIASVIATGAPGLALAQSSAAQSASHARSSPMSEEPTNARKSFGDIAPHLAEITDKVLFGDVWANTTLSPRDRSLVTITSLISLYRINELPFHLKKALENGITKDEIIETITHLAFYAGWPPAMTALQIVRKVFEGGDE